jgi:hypothetical protein
VAFEQCDNVQIVTAAESLATDMVQAPSDKQQIEPMLCKLGAVRDRLGKPRTLLADSRLFQCRSILTTGTLNSMPSPS